ncbi:hypothetical protein AMECASPLE_032520, partial [Ameca splendens]
EELQRYTAQVIHTSLCVHPVFHINPCTSWHSLHAAIHFVSSDNTSAPLHIHKLCHYGSHRW